MKMFLPAIIFFAGHYLIYFGIIPCVLADKIGDINKKCQNIKHIFFASALIILSLLVLLLS